MISNEFFPVKRSMSGSFLKPPDRWISCPRRSDGLIGGIFVATKTFLDNKFDKIIPHSSFFSPNMINSIERCLNIKIGLIIDLTNSKKYYSPQEFERLGIAYTKISCTGVDGPPGLEHAQTFVQICKIFLEKNPNKKILVHCTHGYNRTGYMIIYFLVYDQGWDVKTALTHFSSIRPPGIYKGDYIEKLIEICSDESEEVNFPTPDLPSWCYDNDNSEKEVLPKSHHPTINESQYQSRAKFPVDDKLITLIDNQEAMDVKKQIIDYFGYTNYIFPGCQPVSLSHQNIYLLQKNSYKVSWKADGTRYFMYIKDARKVYMIDREFNIFLVQNLIFPANDDPQSHLKNVLLDGELIFEKDNTVYRPRFLIFDLMIFNNEPSDMYFTQRLKKVSESVIKPRDNLFSKDPSIRLKEAFSVRVKLFFDKSEIVTLVEKFMKKITHETDGVVFQPEKYPYITGRCDIVLKWKPSHLNSVDFLLKIVHLKREGCLKETEGHLFVLGKEGYFTKIMITNELAKYNNKIIECTFDNITKLWKFLRVREDKSIPNALETAINVCMTIKDPVTIDEIYKTIQQQS